MKKILLVLVMLSLPLMSACTPEIIRAGAERDAVLYSSQIAMEATRINVPACRLTAKPGEEIRISGVDEFACFGGSGGGDNEIAQRISPVWNFLSQNSGILGMLGFSALMFPSGLNPAPAIGPSPEVVTIPTQIVNPVVVRP